MDAALYERTAGWAVSNEGFKKSDITRLRTRLPFYRAKGDPPDSPANSVICLRLDFQCEMSVSICKVD